MPKFKIYGYSDDLLEIEGVDHDFEREECPGDSVVEIKFSDGTEIRGAYGKDQTACWRFNVVNQGSAIVVKTQTGDEDAENSIENDVPAYSDVLTIEHPSPDFFFTYAEYGFRQFP